MTVIDAETRQRLLELIHGLLDEEEATDLRARIDADPDYSHAFAEARRRAELLDSAAKLESPRIPLRRSKEETTAPSRPTIQKPTPPKMSTGVRSLSRGINWLVAVSAGLLLAMSLVGWFSQRYELAGIAADHVRLRVSGPSQVQEGVESRFQVTTTAITGKSLPTKIQFAVYRPDGTRLMAHTEQTDEQGLLEVTVPGDLELPDVVRLEILAGDSASPERVEARLSVRPRQYATQLSMDKPIYQPGQIVRYRSLTLSRFGMAADREMSVAFDILAPGGASVPGAELEGRTEHGVGNGRFPLPVDLSGGKYTLVARSLDDTFVEQRLDFLVRRYRLPRLNNDLEFVRDSYAPGETVLADLASRRTTGEAASAARLRITGTVDGEVVYQGMGKTSPDGTFRIKFVLPDEIRAGDGQLVVAIDDGGTLETVAKRLPINLGKVDNRFYPEGGYLAPGMENRVYFTSHDPLGEPTHVRGVVIDDQGVPHVRVETKHEGMGEFSFVPQSGRSYALRLDSPSVEEPTPLPDVPSGRLVILNTGSGVFDSKSVLEFNVRTVEAGLPLVAAARCQGVPVGQQTFVTDEGANSVAIALPDEAAGVIQLTIYDYRTSPPEPIAERLVYRRPSRQLSVDLDSDKPRYTPGETVRLTVTCQNELGQPEPAALGLAVVDQASLALVDNEVARMPTHFFLATEIENPADLEKADFYLSDSPEASVALDLLLGTQGWRRFARRTWDDLAPEDRSEERFASLVTAGSVAEPPAMFDNLAVLQTRYKQSLGDFQLHRQWGLNALTNLSFLGGVGLLLMVAMLGLLHSLANVRLWVPAVGVAAACIIIGVASHPTTGGFHINGAVAFSQFAPEPPESRVVARGESEGIEEEYEDGFGEEVEAEPSDEFDNVDFLKLEAAAFEAMEGAGLAGAEIGQEKGLAEDEEAFFAVENRLEAALGDNRPAAAPMMRRKDENARGMLMEAPKEAIADRNRSFFVREYAHRHRNATPDVRSDFTETLFWHPLLNADEQGTSTVSFDLSDSLTSFQVLASANNAGRIGVGQATVVSRIPFSLEPKLPVQATVGDHIEMPLAIVNDTDRQLAVVVDAELPESVAIQGSPHRELNLEPGERRREYFAMDVLNAQAMSEMTFRGKAANLTDAVKQSMDVVPQGFPRKQAFSGTLDGEQDLVVDIPKQHVAHSLTATLTVYPSPLADLQGGLEGILREPCGCFEQASTANYPNVMLLTYLSEHPVASPGVTRRAKQLLTTGYDKLTGYECGQNGFEWFGAEPGHEALTAYGLMQFHDMTRVFGVEEAMIERTAEWLLDRRDGQGSFLRNEKALDSFGQASPAITDAYIVWALSETGEDDLRDEVRHVLALASDGNDPYLIALAAAAAINTGEHNEGRQLLDRLASLQAEDGHLEGLDGSITRSGGISLKVETTALAALAWLKLPAYTANAHRAVAWIIENRQPGGGFGATQATVLALKALVEQAKVSVRGISDGTLIVRRGETVLAEQAFEAGRHKAIRIDGLESKLSAGENRLTLSLDAGNRMPYSLSVGYHMLQPDDDEKCPLRIETALGQDSVVAGDSVRLTASLGNSTDRGLPMTLMIVGIPAGLEAQDSQLEALQESGAVDYYETRPGELIFYWRGMAPEETHQLALDLLAIIPGRYTGPASRGYLYYTPEQVRWAAPLPIAISRE